MDPAHGKKKARKAKDLGRLHTLLIRGLPDWIDDDGILMVRDIAKHVGVSGQAAYKWLANESLQTKRISALVKMSEESRKPFPEGYGPLTKADFWEFLG